MNPLGRGVRFRQPEPIPTNARLQLISSPARHFFSSRRPATGQVGATLPGDENVHGADLDREADDRLLGRPFPERENP